jgi:small-conductance mechanosensitive channel
MYALLGLFALDMARGLVDTQPFSSRMSLLVITLLGLAVIIWTLATRRDLAGNLEGAWARVAHLVARVSLVTLTASIIANVAGIVSLAELLGEGTITTIFAGFGLHALLLVLLGLLDVILQSPAGSGIRAFKRNADIVRERVSAGLYLIALAAWIFAMLSFFRLWPFVRDHTAGLFSSSLSVGTFQISLGDVVAFIVALWVGTLLSRFIRFILAEDVFTRVRLPRGVPATISMMVNYGIITVAFFIALAVAGFDLTRFALIAGALSVGIGFGLQNVVNNFVSGLILAFERPISVGDSVEVGPLMGRVNRIGIRSSVVRTFDGSEVIVPNADFISKEVINWTLSDVNRRLIVPAGVAYGTNPHQVLELLVKVARTHPDVLQEPEPYALFIGFGASSLDFELRAWCDFSEGLRIKTELNLGIHDALKEAGIEIPFPQRDLHLRSVDAKAGQTISGRSLLRYPNQGESIGDEEFIQADTSVIPEAEE